MVEKYNIELDESSPSPRRTGAYFRIFKDRRVSSCSLELIHKNS